MYRFRKYISILLFLPAIVLAQQTNVITPGEMADIKFADLNGDGYADVIFNGKETSGQAIALNDGTGIFSRSALEVGSATISCGFSDFDNNGLIDYYVFGDDEDGRGTIYFQNTDGTFTKDQSSFLNTDFLDPDVTIIDFNNDGAIDIFISAWDNINSQRFSALYLNDGTGKFSVSSQPELIQKSYGSSVWADLNGDGWPDLLLNGDGGADGEDSNDIYRLYENDEGTLKPVATFNDFRQISIGDGARLVDWNNDGITDIILSGWSNTKNRQVTMLFTGTDKFGFSYTEDELSDTDFPGVSESSIETADLNNDGRIDLLITGFNGNQTDQVGKYNRNIFGYYLNQSENINTKPNAPTLLSNKVEYVDGESIVTLSWNAASDDKTMQNSLTYNLLLKNKDTGTWLYNPLAITSGSSKGWRRIAAPGNVFGNKKWVLKGLPAGTYEWNVQAIDANFMGGSFSISHFFTIETTGLKEILEGVKILGNNNTIKIKNNSGNSINVLIYDTTGKLLKKNKTESDISFHFSKGIYFVKAFNTDKTLVKKIVLL